MTKKIVAVVGTAVWAALTATNAGPAVALPGCVASTATPVCSIRTDGGLVEILGRAESGSLTIYNAAGGMIGSYGWGTGLASLAYTSEVFGSAQGGTAVLAVQGVGAVSLGKA